MEVSEPQSRREIRTPRAVAQQDSNLGGFIPAPRRPQLRWHLGGGPDRGGKLRTSLDLTRESRSAQTSATSRTRRPWIVLVAIGAAGLLIRAGLAAATDGTNDVVSWLAFIDAARTHGAFNLYGITEWPTVPALDFNHGPLAAFGIQVAVWGQDVLPISERLLIRLPAIAADAGSTVLMYVLIAGRFGSRRGLMAAAMVAFNPVLILVSGFHGNTDPVFVALVLLAVVLLERNMGLAAGIAFAASIGVKIVPVLAAPAIVLSIGAAAMRLRFIWATLAASAVLWLPPFLLDPDALIRNVLHYRGRSGIWGIGALASPLGQDLGVGWFREVWTILVLVAVVASGRLLAKRGHSAVAWSIAAAFLVFLTVTPGFGVQYLVWPVLFLIVAAPGFAAVYSAVAGVFLFAVYAFWSGGGWSLGYANSWIADPMWSPGIEATKQLLWILIAVLAFLIHRRRPQEMVSESVPSIGSSPIAPAHLETAAS